MKRRIITIAVAMLVATAALAEAPQRRTIFIRNGEVISEGEVFTDGRRIVLAGKRPFLGVSLVDLTGELREHYGAPKSSGVLVGSVDKDSPAERAGVRVGDVVLSIDGNDINSSAALRLALREKKEGDAVRVEVLRGRSRQTLVATVVEREPVVLGGRELEALNRAFREANGTPEWRARVLSTGGCNELQTRIKELESRLKELEKKLQK